MVSRYACPLRTNFSEPWRDWADAQLAGAASRAPWLAAGPLAALCQEARQGRGKVRLMYTFAVLLAWLETHPLND